MTEPSVPERRRLSDENVIWFVAEVVPVLTREIRDPIVNELRDWRVLQAAVNTQLAKDIAEVKSLVRGHTLQCFIVALVTAAVVSFSVVAYLK